MQTTSSTESAGMDFHPFVAGFGVLHRRLVRGALRTIEGIAT